VDKVLLSTKTSVVLSSWYAVESSPLTSREYISVDEMSEMKSLAAFDETNKRAAASDTAAMLKSQRRRESGPDCRRKHARKSRLCIKNEPTAGESSVGKTAYRHHHRPLTPNTSPIHLLPFSPSQVVSFANVTD